ncbi:hypothetical protein C2S52_017795 [Perilla frutescens var. hirtella]|uniref:Uncharacterized protein n=1 Tax=Perilla frutescens var. hirtella TaxID=608512 RepID=A0AAD4IM30_PERFH|nr:hypothetical protein C2S53_019034 [Perilla frutescens var. hirtella]KAH6766812.1 hypothetical protein C2S52_017795 [Perilla frutescens var. hirtella]KAH6811556.1 hypothetical protein C2S51_025318 [Perilla frutescens var. frutescens]KAH6813641.1 hypothetical protein C2S51_022659 [Perilla frutescens var. frutescens]
MKEFSGSPGLHSAPLGPPTGEKGEPEIKWVSEDANTKRSNRERDLPDVPRSSRRNQSGEGNCDSPKKRDPTKVKQRRNHSKDSSEGSVRSSRREQQDSTQPSDSTNPGIPDPAKRSRRKKSRDSNGTGGSTRPRSKTNASADTDSEPSVKNPELDPIQ